MNSTEAKPSECCDCPTYRDSTNGGTYCTVCDREQPWSEQTEEDA